MKHGYWPARGGGQIGRLLIAYTGVECEDIRYTVREKWFDDDKKNLGLDFPNLPYLIDGDFKITESNAIHRYIIMKSGKTQLLGKDLKDQTTILQLEGALSDGVMPMAMLFYNPKYEEALPGVLEKLKGKLDLLKKFIGEKPLALGYLTIFDFKVAEFSHYIEKIAPETFKEYEFLGRIRENFNNLPEIKAYYEKEDSVKGPFTGPTAAIQF